MQKAQTNRMGTEPLLPLILKMSIPAMFSMIIQALYNIVDSIFVARIDEEALTAVSLAFPIQTLLIAVAIGTSVGLNSLISRRLGQHRVAEADDAAAHGLVLAVCSGAAFALLGALFIRPFFASYRPDPKVLRYGCEYGYIVTLCSLGMFMQINIEKTLQATGSMVLPMLIQLAGALTNIVLDPIFIFGLLGVPAMGVRGAAIATVIGQCVGMILGLLLLFGKKHEVTIRLRGFRVKMATIVDIYRVGLPSIVMQTVASVLTVALNAILIGFSATAVSVLGIYYKLQSFVFMPVFGLTQGTMPIMGYNFGAKDKQRLLGTLKIGCVIALLIMLIGTLVFMAIPELLLGMFNQSETMLRMGVPALRIISLCFISAAVGIMISTFFQAVGEGVYSLIVSLLRQLIVILPAAYLLSRWVGVVGVWWSFPIAELVSLIASLVLLIHVYRKRVHNLM